MSHPSRADRPIPSDEDEEVPLDPAVERIRQRLKRLILVSVATLLIGLIAVIIAVIYKVAPPRDKPALTATDGETMAGGALPAGATVLSSALDGTMLALTYANGGLNHVVVVDLRDGKVLRRFVLDAGATPATP